MKETEHLFLNYRKSDGFLVEIGWNPLGEKNIGCWLCHQQGKLTICENQKQLAKHILIRHPEIFNRSWGVV